MVIKTNKISVMGAAVAAMLFAGQAYAANSVTTSATVEIAAPIAITQTAALAFGNLGPSGTSGTATVAPGASSVSVTGGVSDLGGTVSSAAYNVTGASGADYSVSIPATISLDSGGNSMTLTLSENSSGTLTGGSESFSVGGSLAIAANQAPGSYSGTFAVTVNYQ